MSSLNVFLHPPVDDEIKEVVISTRWKDEDGNPVPFKIKALTQAENEALVKKSTRYNKASHMKELDQTEYSNRLVVAATVFPDFSSMEMLEAYNAGRDPLMVPGKMLLAGEYAKLTEEISNLSGFGSAVDVEEEAKN